MNELALFAGAGGGILGGYLCGWRTVAAVEIEEYPRAILLQRQLDRILPRFPIWDDVCTFDGKPWAGRVDIITGGFPCQDISAAGKGAGIDGERSGLWKEMARIIGEVRPRYVLVENSPMLTSRGLGRVLGDLAKMGYDAEWGVLGADDAGAPHQRKRIWILAHARQEHERQGYAAGMEADKEQRTIGAIHDQSSGEGSGNVVDTVEVRLEAARAKQQTARIAGGCKGSWWSSDPADGSESRLGRVANGVAHRVDRLAAIGNGQVPAVVRLAIAELFESRIKGGLNAV